MQNNFLDTPVATHGFTPRGVLMWEALIKEAIALRAQVNILTAEVSKLRIQRSPLGNVFPQAKSAFPTKR